ncbi:MAG TPA: ATP-dependent DNA helicase RecQ [Bacteroidia bacterium]|nr:ATP-dependent DNA helicase RecQ [Bacteroidia bacterium]
MINHIQQILTRYWGYTSFRPLQQEIILSVLEGRDTLALLPTGGGKSICFQVPAMAKEGVCIVVSPLIALMKDQVEHLVEKGIPAVAVVSGMNKSEIDIALDNCIYGKIKFLYLSPERLSSDLFLARLQKMKVGLIAVDEAHCISQWGYDFRPSYLKIAEIRNQVPNVPILALTASATPDVQVDIQEKLSFTSAGVFRKSFERKNLSYIVLHEEDKLQRMLKIMDKIQGTGIVYVRTRKKSKEISEFLVRNSIRAGYYHAGLSSAERAKIQDEWMKGKIRVVVSTNAFGMGIDKSNVRFVIHQDIPDSLEAYYQEAGRAGRDEQKSYAVLLYNESDILESARRLEMSFPDVQTIRKTYQALANYFQLPVGSGKGVSFDFDISAFCSAYNLQVAEVFSSLKILELQGLLASSESADLHSKIHVIANAQQLYEFQVKNPRIDHFIKVILRSYEGLFDEYVVIKEHDIAKRASIGIEECRSLLHQLNNLKLIHYVEAKDTPQITFLEERLDSKNLHIDRENLSDRKKRYSIRQKAMLHYAASNDKCRSMLLVNYFGEESRTRCGVCDVCLQRNKVGLSDLEFETISGSIKSQLSKGKISLEELVSKVHEHKEDKTLKVIEWLIENDTIRYANGNVLEWTRSEV